MYATQQPFAVDAFINAGTYSGHTYKALKNTLRGVPVTLLPLTLAAAVPHLQEFPFEVVFIDGNHSLLGFCQDVCLSLQLLRKGGILLCHDVAEWFPAVPALLTLLIDKGVLEFVEQRASLGMYIVKRKPTWLTRALPVNPD
jgi:hypothetical protein